MLVSVVWAVVELGLVGAAVVWGAGADVEGVSEDMGGGLVVGAGVASVVTVVAPSSF